MPAVTSVAVGVGTAAAGVYSARKTAKANEKAQDKALSSEKSRRQAAADELQKATDNYNNLRKERPGLTVQQYLLERAEALEGPEADRVRKAIQEGRQEDFERAQAVADQASLGNIKTFDVILDAVSGGRSADIIAERNRNALQTNELDAFNRALELRSTAIPAGTVRLDNEGRFVEGQRADKQAFQLAFETSEALRDKQFGKLNTILRDDRSIAERQQARALDFLSTQSTSPSIEALSQAGATRLDAFQSKDESVQLQAIRDFQNAAFTDQTAQPVPQSNQAASSLISGGFDLALKGLSQFGKEG